MKVHIHTLGCKVNQFESQAMASILASHGHTVTEEESGLDAIIINTCAVTAESVRKSRQAVRHLKAQNPGALVAICGCWSQAEADEAAKLGDVVFGSGDKAGFIAALEGASEDRAAALEVDDPFARRVFEMLPAGSAEGRTRALLKIQDGCANFCSYCIIPYTRGHLRSLPLDKCASEAARLKGEGCHEIVLTGIEIASYGQDIEGRPSLADAVEAVCKAAPGVRVRLGSLEPRVVTEEFAERLAALPNLCPHFHLSLQSGCDGTLARMRRKYDTTRFYESVTILRKFFPNCGITADLITGFPGETEEEFAGTCEFIEKCAFSSMHVFPYSLRDGTRAATMEGQIPKAVKHSRAREAAKIAKRMKTAFLAAQVGLVHSVLFEQEVESGVWSGHTGNYCEVRAKGGALHNTVANVQIIESKDGVLWGNILL